MKESSTSPDSKEHKWQKSYTVAAILGITYIILLGLFTLIFNYTL